MNELFVTIGVILFPGLVAAVICDKIIVHADKWDALKYGIYSFVFGVLSYMLLQAAVSALAEFNRYVPLLPSAATTLMVWTVATPKSLAINLGEILWAAVIAPVVAGAAAFIVNYKILNKVAKKLRISTKFGDENLFSYFLNLREIDWVYVRDITNGLTYQGRVVSFSEADGMQELVLSEVTVFSYETSDEFYSIPIIYLAKPTATFIIEAVPFECLEKEDGKKAVERGSNAQPSEGGHIEGSAANGEREAVKTPAAASEEKVTAI